MANNVETYFSPEQLQILKNGFQQHDFTDGVTLENENKISVKDAKQYVWLKKIVLGYFRKNLPRFGFKRLPQNYSKDFPVNKIIDVDAGYIAEKGVEILSDKQRTAKTVKQFFKLFWRLIFIAARSYCRTFHKSIFKLSIREWNIILKRVADVAGEELTHTVMLGQKIPEIIESAHDAPAHEDYKEGYYCTDATNFHNKWNHARAKIGDMLSLEENQEEWEGHEPGVEDDNFSTTILNLFSKRLDNIDTTIVLMLMDGYTQMEIAQKLGYKNNGAVSKRLKRIREKWDEFAAEADID